MTCRFFADFSANLSGWSERVSASLNFFFGSLYATYYLIPDQTADTKEDYKSKYD